jgi:hypothetical protein
MFVSYDYNCLFSKGSYVTRIPIAIGMNHTLCVLKISYPFHFVYVTNTKKDASHKISFPVSRGTGIFMNILV